MEERPFKGRVSGRTKSIRASAPEVAFRSRIHETSQHHNCDPLIPPPQMRIILQLRMLPHQLPRRLIALRPILPKDASPNLPSLHHLLQPPLYGHAYVPARAGRPISVNHFQQDMLLLPRERNLPIQSLQRLMNRRPVRFDVYRFDLQPSQPTSAAGLRPARTAEAAVPT